MDNEFLKIDDLCWKPEKNSKYILKNITNVFAEGGFYGILGPNGSGKTSLIKHMLRFLDAKDGNIYLDNKNIKDYPRKKIATKISFVPQNVNIEVDFNVYDIIAMGRTPYQKRFQDLSAEDIEIIDYAMEITNCKSLKNKSFSYLSGGEAQRVLVARAIAQDTKYILLDEPISHLDIRYQIDVMETLKRLNKEKNKTIIAILHDLNIAAAYCNEVVLMKDGTILNKGAVDKVLTKENLKKVYDIEFEVYNRNNTKQLFFMPYVR